MITLSCAPPRQRPPRYNMIAPLTQVPLIERLQDQLIIDNSHMDPRDCRCFDDTYRPFLMAVTSWLSRVHGLSENHEEDVVQEIMVDLYVKRHLLKYQRINPETGDVQRLSTWLRYKVLSKVGTLARSCVRRSKHEVNMTSFTLDDDTPPPDAIDLKPTADAQIMAREQEIEDQFLYDIARERVLGRRREPLSCIKFQRIERGESYETVAVDSGCTVNALQVLMHSIREAIKREVRNMQLGEDLQDLIANHQPQA